MEMKNTVELLGHYGGDKEHALSAWTSTSRDWENKAHRMPELLKMLADSGHKTPFEKSTLHFLVTTDIATHIHILKHRIGVSVNAESARYKELKEDKFYLPDDWPTNWLARLHAHCIDANNLYHDAVTELTPILGRKRAKESARYFKTYASQITADVMFNFSSFVHFQQLRNSEHAQVEIRQIAEKMLTLVHQLPDFEHSLKAFNL